MVLKNQPPKESPHSIEVEQSVIGSLLIDNNNIDKLDVDMDADDFYAVQHQLIFKSIKNLIVQKKPADIVTVSESLSERQLRECGGLAYLADLVSKTPSALNFVHYVDMLKNYSTNRKLLSITQNIHYNIINASYSEKNSSHHIIDEAEKALFSITEQDTSTTFKPIKKVMGNIFDYLESTDVKFTPTGMDALDSKMSVFEPNEITIVGARPAMGKTAFLLSIVANYIWSLYDNKEKEKTKPFVIFSLEMDAEQLMMRIFSIMTGIVFSKFKDKTLSDEDYGKISNSMAILLDVKKNIIIDDDPHLTPEIFKRKMRHYTRRYGQAAFVAIDYVQLMTTKQKTENRATELATISRQLKIHIKEFNVPLMLLAQLNRALEGRGDKRPMLADLKESGALEQDASNVIFLYRDEVYNEHSEFKGIAELILAKARNGPTGKVRVQFHAPCMHYRNLAHRIED